VLSDGAHGFVEQSALRNASELSMPRSCSGSEVQCNLARPMHEVLLKEAACSQPFN